MIFSSYYIIILIHTFLTPSCCIIMSYFRAAAARIIHICHFPYYRYYSVNQVLLLMFSFSFSFSFLAFGQHQKQARIDSEGTKLKRIQCSGGTRNTQYLACLVVLFCYILFGRHGRIIDTLFWYLQIDNVVIMSCIYCWMFLPLLPHCLTLAIFDDIYVSTHVGLTTSLDSWYQLDLTDSTWIICR